MPCDWCIVPENNALFLGAEVSAEIRTQNNSDLAPLFPGTQHVQHLSRRQHHSPHTGKSASPYAAAIFSFGQRCEKAKLVCTSLVIPEDMALLHLVCSLRERKSIQVC